MTSKLEKNDVVSRYIAQKLVYRYMRHLLAHCTRLNHWTLDYAFGFRGKSLLHPLFGTLRGVVSYTAGGCYTIDLDEYEVTVRPNGEAQVSTRNGKTVKAIIPNAESINLLCQLLRMAVAQNNKSEFVHANTNGYNEYPPWEEVRHEFDASEIC